MHRSHELRSERSLKLARRLGFFRSERVYPGIRFRLSFLPALSWGKPSRYCELRGVMSTYLPIRQFDDIMRSQRYGHR